MSKQAEKQYKLLLDHRPAHAVLLIGPSGVGLKTIATSIATHHGEVTLIEPILITKTSTTRQIGIERIRELYEQVRTKHTRSRFVVIDDADMITIAAQNALLKLLEEPNESTVFILTSHQPDRLLPTIRSRLQAYTFSAISSAQTERLLADLPSLPPQKRAQLLFIANGLPAELIKLSMDERLFRERASLFQQAKELLGANRYDVLVKLIKGKPSRQTGIELVDVLIALLSHQPTKLGLARIDKLLECRDSISGGGNVTLQLVSAMVY